MARPSAPVVAVPIDSPSAKNSIAPSATPAPESKLRSTASRDVLCLFPSATVSVIPVGAEAFGLFPGAHSGGTQLAVSLLF